MMWISISLLALFIIILLLILHQFKLRFDAFDELLTKFIEVNQAFYEGQIKVEKKDKELITEINKIITELNIIRKYSGTIQLATKGMLETTRNLKETQKTVSDTVNDLKVNDEIAKNLSVTSGNIKILDHIANILKSAIDTLNRRNKNATK
jgi:hypothetical protein